MSKNDEKLLTDTELELMNIIWDLGGGTVRDVIEKLPPERDLAYTSVSTILRILEKKHILDSIKEGKTHIYVPKIDRTSYQKKGLGHFIDSLFSGTPSSLVKTLLESKKLKKEDLEELKNLIDDRIESK